MCKCFNFFLIVLLSSTIANAITCKDLVSNHINNENVLSSLIHLTGDITLGTPNSYHSLKFLHSRVKAPGLEESKDEVLDFWVRENPDDFSISDSVTVSKESEEGFVECGTCYHMSVMHLRSFLYPLLRVMGDADSKNSFYLENAKPRLDSGKFVLVFSNGELLGSVKLLGAESYLVGEDGYFSHNPRLTTTIANPTFLALKNIKNSAGEITMLAGGVYYIEHDFFSDVVLPEVNLQGPYTEVPGVKNQIGFYDSQVRRFLLNYQVGVIEVDKLHLRPQTFLLHAKSLNHSSHNTLWSTLASTIRGNGPSTVHDVGLLWSHLLEKFRKTSSFIEEERKKDPHLSQLRDDIIKGLGSVDIFDDSQFMDESVKGGGESVQTINPFSDDLDSLL